MIFSGTVEKGNGAGKRLGFPTANIPLNDASVSGIYAGIVVMGEETYKAAVYADQRRNLLESHLLDFSDDLYGKTIVVSLLKKLREDQAFDSLDALIARIAEDVIEARKYFENAQV